MQLIRGVTGSAGVLAISLLLSLVTGAILARALGPDGYGIYAFLLSLITLLSLPTKAGLPTLLVREVARYQLKNKWGLMRGILKASNIFAATYSFVVIIIAVIFLAPMTDEKNIPDGALLWSLCLLPLIGFEAIRSGALRGLRWVVSAQLPEQIIRPSALVVTVGVFLLLGGDLTPLKAIQFNAMAAVFAFFIGLFLLLRALPRGVSGSPARYEIKPWALSLLPLSLFAGLKILDSQVSVLFLGFLGTNEEVGLFRVAATGASLVAFGLNAINMAMAPQVARLYSAGDIVKLQRLVSLSTKLMAAISFPVAVFFIFFGETIIGLVFGQEYKTAAPALSILCLGQLVNTSSGSVALLLNMTGNDRHTVIGAGLALISNLILSVLLVPGLGLIGAAIAFSASLTIWNLLLMSMVKKKLGINTYLGAR